MADETKELEEALNNQADKERDLTQERNDRCVPIANEALKLMVQAEVSDISVQDLAEKNKDVILNIMKLYLAKEVRVSEVNYIHRLILNSYDLVANTIINSLNRHLNTASDIFWKKQSEKPLDEITLKDLDVLLLEGKKAKDKEEDRMVGKIDAKENK